MTVYPDADVEIVRAALENGIADAALFLTEMGFSKCKNPHNDALYLHLRHLRHLPV